MNDAIKEAFSPTLVSAFIVLIVGWILAVVLSKLAKRLLANVKIDRRLVSWMTDAPPPGGTPGAPAQLAPVWVGEWVSKAVFYVIMGFALVTFFDLLTRTPVLDPLNLMLTPLVGYMPSLINAVILLVVACLVATVIKRVIIGVLNLAKVDETLSGTLSDEPKGEGSVRGLIANIVFWLVIFFFLPAILAPLGLPDLLEPLSHILDRIFNFAPNILAAVAILLIGGFALRIIRHLIAGGLAKAGLDRLTEKWGETAGLGDTKLSGLIAHIIYLLLWVTLLGSALEALNLDTIYAPAALILGRVTGVLPGILGAGLVLIVATVLGKLLGGIVTSALTALGLNALWVKLGWSSKLPEPGSGPARVLGQLVFVVIVLLAAAEAASLVGLETASAAVSNLVLASSHVTFGIAIFGCGIVVARWASEAIVGSDVSRAGTLAAIVRATILILFGAIALRQMHLADDVVTLGFGLAFGAIAVAFALAFGLGGRAAAGQASERWINRKPTVE